MNLTESNFTNTNTNFDNVVFVIVDGTLKINPINATVTITGNTNVATFDGAPHTVTGYVATCENTLYNVHGDFTFSGDSTATQTTVGTKNMGLAANQFTNTNSNFGTVTFNVTDGYQRVVAPDAVTVTITEHSGTVNYNGAEQRVTGYDVTSIKIGGEPTTLYTAADFTFSGCDTAKGTNAGTYAMNLTPANFTNTNTNFDNVTFVIVDGTLTISPINATVTIVGANNTTSYDGAEHSVNGYTATASTDLYDVNSNIVFSGTAATATRTDAGTANMGLTREMFTNTNTNFTNVIFNVTDGYQTINPIDVTVTITGNTATVNYDGQSHTVTGYTASCANTLYNVNSNLNFSGEAKATRTNAGTTDMNLSESQFENTNSNFGTVFFNIIDGKMTVNPIAATVTITEHSGTANYDGNEHVVTGYDVATSNPLYTADYFTFTGDSTVRGTNADTYAMNLVSTNFTNTNGNFDPVTFNVTDGTLTINPINVTVNITGNTNVATFDAAPHTVTGFTATCENPLYNVHGDFTYSGDSTATQTSVGTKNMGLLASQFTNTNANFSTVTFSITDGYQSVVAPGAVIVTITEHGGEVNYDGQSHTVTGYDVAISDPLYTESDFTFSGSASVSGTNAGSYPMTLTPDNFTNTNTNFDNVTFVTRTRTPTSTM